MQMAPQRDARRVRAAVVLVLLSVPLLTLISSANSDENDFGENETRDADYRFDAPSPKKPKVAEGGWLPQDPLARYGVLVGLGAVVAGLAAAVGPHALKWVRDRPGRL